MNNSIITLLIQLATINNIDQNIVLAVAKTESNYNVNMVGVAGEMGVMQIMPQNFKKANRRELSNSGVNIALGVYLLAEAKRTCKHQKNNTWLVCYNLGNNRANKVKHPEKWPYYVKVLNEYKRLSHGQ